MDKHGGKLVRMATAVQDAMAKIGVGPRRVADKHMQVLETLTIGPKKQLVLVSCCGERYLVGTGADNVDVITPVSTARDGASR